MAQENHDRPPVPRAQNHLRDLSPTSTMETGKVESQAFSVDKESNPISRWRFWRRKVDSRLVADSILGLSDGLTVPFALTAGLTEFGTTSIVILGGLAELIAGAISMGLGGFVGAKSEMESYQATSRKCDDLIQNNPRQTRSIVQHYFEDFDVPRPNRDIICDKLTASSVDMHAFLMKHHFDVAEPANSRPYISALTLGVSYFAGGFLPLLPYFIVPKDEVIHGLYWSIGLMAIVLVVFGYVKTCVVRGWRGKENLWAALKGALQMLVVGALAAGAAVGVVRLINRNHALQATPSSRSA